MKIKSQGLVISCITSFSMLAGVALSATAPVAAHSNTVSIAANKSGQTSAPAKPAVVATEPLKLQAPHVALQGEPAEAPWWQGHLVLGARMYMFQLADTRRTVHGQYSNSNVRGNFIGSVWGLDENQDYLPRLNLSYWFNRYVGLGLTYDQVSAKTKDWGNIENTVTSSDGDVNIWGPMVYVSGRAPNSTLCTPFAELGWATYTASFDESASWAATAPGYRFEVDNTSGFYLGLGLDFEINSNWSVDVYWRQMNNAEVDARAYFTPSSRVGRYGAFPMDYDMYGIGVNYHF